MANSWSPSSRPPSWRTQKKSPWRQDPHTIVNLSQRMHPWVNDLCSNPRSLYPKSQLFVSFFLIVLCQVVFAWLFRQTSSFIYMICNEYFHTETRKGFICQAFLAARSTYLLRGIGRACKVSRVPIKWVPWKSDTRCSSQQTYPVSSTTWNDSLDVNTRVSNDTLHTLKGNENKTDITSSFLRRGNEKKCFKKEVYFQQWPLNLCSGRNRNSWLSVSFVTVQHHKISHNKGFNWRRILNQVRDL